MAVVSGDTSALIGRVEFSDGTQLTLHRSSLVHRGPSHLETLPLAGIASARVAFSRDGRRLGWAIGLLAAALVLLAAFAPLGAFASRTAGEMAATGSQGVAPVLLALFRVVEALAGLLPLLAIACGIVAALLGVLGWRGSTVLTLTLAGVERVFAVSGRDSLLMDFNELISEQLVSLER